MNDEHLRRSWVLPPMTGTLDDIDLSLLDPSDEDDRHILILAEHPELHSAIEDEAEEVDIDGQPFNPRLHLAMHEVVAAQIWDDNPPEMWTTAQRLTGLGYQRHEILHMLASVVSSDVYNTLQGQKHDPVQTARALEQLPGSWQAQRGFTGNRAARRASARRRSH